MSNLPPGCTVHDLPGYDEQELTVPVECDYCDHVFDADIIVDGSTMSVDVDCPNCNAVVTIHRYHD